MPRYSLAERNVGSASYTGQCHWHCLKGRERKGPHGLYSEAHLCLNSASHITVLRRLPA